MEFNLRNNPDLTIAEFWEMYSSECIKTSYKNEIIIPTMDLFCQEIAVEVRDMFHYINILYNDIIWFMNDFNFDTTDISTAIDLMKEADSMITNEFEIEFKSRFSSSKSIDWKDYALGKRR